MIERKVCTKEHPMPEGDKGYWMHPDAEYKGDDSSSSYEKYHCPNCGLNFRVTIAD